jgi:hypothetical protein
MSMSTVRTLEEDDPSILDPIVRIIGFSDEPAVRTTTWLLRQAWLASPPSETIDKDCVAQFMKEISRRDTRAINESERDPDVDNINTPWRREIAVFWKHVFADTVRFLDAATAASGHMRSHDLFQIYYPETIGSPSSRNKMFDTNVLLIPTFVDPDITLRITRDKSTTDGAIVEQKVCTFDLAKKPNTICFLRRGFAFNFYVDGEQNKSEQDTAAVFALCVLCTDEH